MPSSVRENIAAIAQLGERQTEDLKVPGSIQGLGILVVLDLEAVAATKRALNVYRVVPLLLKGHMV